MHISYFVSDICHYDGRRCMKVAAAGVVTHWRQQGKWWRCDQPRHVCYDLHIILFVKFVNVKFTFHDGSWKDD